MKIQLSDNTLLVATGLIFIFCVLFTNFQSPESKTSGVENNVISLIDSGNKESPDKTNSGTEIPVVSSSPLSAINSGSIESKTGSENLEETSLTGGVFSISSNSGITASSGITQLEQVNTINLPILYSETIKFKEKSFIEKRLLLILLSYLEDSKLTSEEFDTELKKLNNLDNLYLPTLPPGNFITIYGLRNLATKYNPKILLETVVTPYTEEKIEKVLNRGLPCIIYYKEDREKSPWFRYIVKGYDSKYFYLFDANGKTRTIEKNIIKTGRILAINKTDE